MVLVAWRSEKSAVVGDIRNRGVFRGGIGPWPPLWVAKIAKLQKSKIEAWPPPLQVGQQALGSKSPDFGQKMGQNLSKNLFFLLFT